jgi:hypothetical protein
MKAIDSTCSTTTKHMLGKDIISVFTGYVSIGDDMSWVSSTKEGMFWVSI